MLVWVLFSALGVYQGVLSSYNDFEIAYEYEEACSGKDYIFPEFVSTLMMARKVIFTPRRGGGVRTLMEENRVLDPRIIRDKSNVKLLDVSKDFDGRYTVILIGPLGNRTLPLVSLHVKDCSIKRDIEFGRSFSFEVSRAVEQIDYSPHKDSEMTVIMWSRSKAIERPGGTLEKRWFVVKKPTYADQGYYTLKDKEGKYVERYRISIKEVHQSNIFKTGEDFTISYPVDSVPFSLTFQPEHTESWLVTLTEDGHLVDSERFEGRIELLSTGVEIRALEDQDGGTFKLRDSDGNLALVIELTVTPLGFADNGTNFFILIGAVVVGIVICLCCVKRCCCRKKNSTTSIPVTQVYQHETTANDDRQSQPYAMVTNQAPYDSHRPLVSAANQEPPASDYLSPPSNSVAAGGGGGLGPIHFQGSAGGGVDAPTVTLGFDCLSSDSGTQFEIPKGRNYPSVPPLSSDTPSFDVYTSDKLNFL